MSTSNEMWWLFAHVMKHCYATALYTTEASAIRYTCAYKFTARVQSHTEGMQKLARYSYIMADYRVLVSVWERYSYLRNEAIYMKNAKSILVEPAGY